MTKPVSNSVPDGLMHRLEFKDETAAGSIPEVEVPPRIPADLPVIFSPGDDGEIVPGT